MTTEPPVNHLIRTAFESPDGVHSLIRQEPDLLEARTGLEETALHYLAVENQLPAVKALVNAGANVNTLNSCGGTPLSEAASLGYVELVQYLLSQGALLHISGQEDPTLHEAVRSGSAAVVELVLAAGAPVNEQNDLHETPLHLAAEKDERLAVLHLLLKAGADPSIKRIFDETPLDVAVGAGSSACAAALLAVGAPRGSSAA